MQKIHVPTAAPLQPRLSCRNLLPRKIKSGIRLYGARFRQQLPLPRPAQRLVIILLPDIICPIASIVQLRLTIAIAQPREAVSGILGLEVVEADLHHGFDVVQGGAGPECGNGSGGPVLVPGAARVVPDGALHEEVFVSDEVVYGFLGGGEGFDVVRLETVD